MRIIKTAKYRENFQNQEMTFCDSCQETNPIFSCSLCGKKIKHKCKECHNELEHGKIENSNIPTFQNDAFKNLVPRQRSKIKG